MARFAAGHEYRQRRAHVTELMNGLFARTITKIATDRAAARLPGHIVDAVSEFAYTTPNSTSAAQ